MKLAAKINLNQKQQPGFSIQHDEQQSHLQMYKLTRVVETMLSRYFRKCFTNAALTDTP